MSAAARRHAAELQAAAASVAQARAARDLARSERQDARSARDLARREREDAQQKVFVGDEVAWLCLAFVVAWRACLAFHFA